MPTLRLQAAQVKISKRLVLFRLQICLVPPQLRQHRCSVQHLLRLQRWLLLSSISNSRCKINQQISSARFHLPKRLVLLLSARLSHLKRLVRLRRYLVRLLKHLARLLSHQRRLGLRYLVSQRRHSVQLLRYLVQLRGYLVLLLSHQRHLELHLYLAQLRMHKRLLRARNQTSGLFLPPRLSPPKSYWQQNTANQFF